MTPGDIIDYHGQPHVVVLINRSKGEVWLRKVGDGQTMTVELTEVEG